MHLFVEVFLRLLVFRLADHVRVEFEDFPRFELARAVNVDQAEQALANVLCHPHLVPLDVVLLVDDFVEEVLELVVVEEAPPEYLRFQHVDLAEEYLERNEVLEGHPRIFLAELAIDFSDLEAELLDVRAGQLAELRAEEIGRGDRLLVVGLQRVELVVPKVFAELIL